MLLISSIQKFIYNLIQPFKVKKKKSSRRSKKRGIMEKKNIIITLVILVLVFIVLISVIPNKQPPQDLLEPKTQVISSLTCEERCKNKDCLKDCYTITINKAVLTQDISLCNTIPLEESKQLCLDKINLKAAVLSKDQGKCNLIINENLKQTCLENAK